MNWKYNKYFQFAAVSDGIDVSDMPEKNKINFRPNAGTNNMFMSLDTDCI